MSDAITLFYQILQILVSWIFNAEIVTGVSIGWVFVSIIVFSLLIRNILNVPKRSTTFKVSKNEKND